MPKRYKFLLSAPIEIEAENVGQARDLARRIGVIDVGIGVEVGTVAVTHNQCWDPVTEHYVDAAMCIECERWDFECSCGAGGEDSDG